MQNTIYCCASPTAGDRIKYDIGSESSVSRGNEPVFLAGSTRHSEEEIILDAYQKVIQKAPNTLLILAPRHLERTRHIEKIIKARGLDYQLRTCLESNGENRTAPVIISDTMGELQAHLQHSHGCLLRRQPGAARRTKTFLSRRYGAKPVLYGPHMEDFLDARSPAGEYRRRHLKSKME